MKLKLKYIVTTALLVTVLITVSYAAAPGFDLDVEDTPIDGGASVVAAAAVAYGVKKIRDKRKK